MRSMPIVSDKRLTPFLLLAILLCAALLRLHHIGESGYNEDESFSIQLASQKPGAILSNIEDEPHPPLYYLLLHYWMGMFGISPTSTRSLSVFFGVASIFLMYWMGRLLFDEETGIIAALVLALSAFHIAHSQESRMYSLMVMLTLASMIFFIKIIRECSNRHLGFYLASSILLLYTHIYGIFIILSQSVYAALISLNASKRAPPLPMKKWFAIQALLAVAFIPWMMVLVRQIIGINNGSFVNLDWLPLLTLSDLFRTVYLYSYYNPLALALFSLLILSAFIPWEKFGTRTNAKQPDPHLLLLLWLLVPILVPFIISAFAVPIFYPKYTISASLAFYLLASRGISQIRGKSLKGMLLIAVMYLSMASTFFYYQN
ncbi:MAG TPA: glycosyltransferase family 39 protein [Candidatus Nanoarchaeia archaeon]|nr:glycosyltransferase family 39 protein [Candidatus Nanoarchaeia archaeon]